MSKTKDMTSGNPIRLMITFAIPILIGNVFQQFYNMVDSIIVGKFVGADALAAVGVTGSTTYLFFSLILGLTTGISVVISQFFGAGDEKALKSAFSTSVYVCIVSSLILAVIGFLLARPLMLLLRTPENIIDDAVLYLHIIMVGGVTMVMYNWIASVLRALGDSVTPLVFLIISSLMNIGLDLLFVTVFHMGVAGVAYATILAQLLSGISCFIYAMIKMPVLRLRKEDLKFDSYMCQKVINIGIPSGVQNSFISISVMIMQAVINGYGSVVVAGYIAATKIESIVFQPGNSIGMANATYTGQNMGAGKIDRVKDGFRAIIIMNVISYIIMIPILWFLAPTFMQLFVDHSAEASQVVEAGTRYIRLVAFFFTEVGILIGMQSFLKSAGDVAGTMLLGFSEVVCRVIFSLGLSGLFGYAGAFAATPAAWVLTCILGLIIYRTGRWKKMSIVGN